MIVAFAPAGAVVESRQCRRHAVSAHSFTCCTCVQPELSPRSRGRSPVGIEAAGYRRPCVRRRDLADWESGACSSPRCLRVQARFDGRDRRCDGPGAPRRRPSGGRHAGARRHEPPRLGRRDPGQRGLRGDVAAGRPPVRPALPRRAQGATAVAVQRRTARSTPRQGGPADHPAWGRDHRGPGARAHRTFGAGCRPPRTSTPGCSRRTASATSATGRRSSTTPTGSGESSTAMEFPPPA